MSKHIVTVGKDHDPQGVAKGHGIKTNRVWKSINAFSAELEDEQIEKLKKNPHVLRVEEDTGTYAFDLSWGLDAIDQRSLPLDGLCALPGNGGEGVNIYIIDTGGYPEHQEFLDNEGNTRLTILLDTLGGDGRDGNRHSTHCAGISAGRTVGVAPRAKIFTLKVLNDGGYGYWEDFIEACEFLITQNTFMPGPVNVSMGGGYVQAANDAVRALWEAGYSVCCAGGNNGDDVATFSPASEPSVISVGAVTTGNAGYERSSFSNWGNLTVWSPGSNIYSSVIGAPNAYAYLSGTSMAAPFVTGTCALAISKNQSVTPSEVKELIQKTSSQGVVHGSLSEMRDLLYARMDSVQDPDVVVPNQPPICDFDYAPYPELGPLSMLFTSKAKDPDGGIINYEWGFGDRGYTQDPIAISVPYTYGAAGIYTVDHVVTDSELVKVSARKEVVVGELPPDPEPEPEPEPFTLVVETVNRKSQKTSYLSGYWGDGETVNVYADDIKVATPPNTGTYAYGPFKGKVPSFKVCDVDDVMCSLEVTSA